MPPKALTPEHKQAMTAGRKEGQAVKAYLDALEQHRPRRGRRRTPDSIRKRLAAIDAEFDGASSSGPKRSGSMSAIGRAPMEKMSRMIPPTPVAAPW